MKFNSQICTSREQSQRLLALGLKPETADIIKETTEVKNGVTTTSVDYSWSLHRLIEMMPEEMYGGLLCIFKDSIRYEEAIMDRLEAHFEVVGENMYENTISCIEYLIKEGYFNKQYLV